MGKEWDTTEVDNFMFDSLNEGERNEDYIEFVYNNAIELSKTIDSSYNAIQAKSTNLLSITWAIISGIIGYCYINFSDLNGLAISFIGVFTVCQFFSMAMCVLCTKTKALPPIFNGPRNLYIKDFVKAKKTQVQVAEIKRMQNALTENLIANKKNAKLYDVAINVFVVAPLLGLFASLATYPFLLILSKESVFIVAKGLTVVLP